MILPKLELDAEQTAIVNYERLLKRAQERRDEERRARRQAEEDAELFGEPLDPEHQRQLDFRDAESERLVERLTAALDAAKRAPEIRRLREARGQELLAQAKAVDAEIARWANTGAPLLARANELVEAIVDEFHNPATGGQTMLPPFKGSSILARLRFFARNTGSRGDDRTFEQRLAEYRRIEAA